MLLLITLITKRRTSGSLSPFIFMLEVTGQCCFTGPTLRLTSTVDLTLRPSSPERSGGRYHGQAKGR